MPRGAIVGARCLANCPLSNVTTLVLRSANGATFNPKPGPTPQESAKCKNVSAESAIHFEHPFVHYRRDAQSLSKVLLHIIFSTKDREPWLTTEVRSRAHAYLATVCRNLNTEWVHVGGVADHVHTVTTLPRTFSQAQLVEHIKKTSSKWIKTLEPRYHRFRWQRGYGAFSVSPSQLKSVIRYIDGQQNHHRTRTFQEEYRELLCKHGIDFDERYVWD